MFAASISRYEFLPAVPPRQSVVDGLRTIALKLDIGVSHNQTFERTIAVHFTVPFHVRTRVADKCNDGTLLLQVILHSQVKASLTIYDAWLDLQYGFAHTGQDDGRPASGFFPLFVSATSRAGVLFSICCLAVGFLPLPSSGLRVGQLVTMQWRVERFKDFEKHVVSDKNDEVLYEVNASSENWMIAGRKRGHVPIS